MFERPRPPKPPRPEKSIREKPPKPVPSRPERPVLSRPERPAKPERPVLSKPERPPKLERPVSVKPERPVLTKPEKPLPLSRPSVAPPEVPFASIAEAATWMREVALSDGGLAQSQAVATMRNRAGEGFLRQGKVGGQVIGLRLLREFASITPDVVYLFHEKRWRERKVGDAPGRIQYGS